MKRAQNRRLALVHTDLQKVARDSQVRLNAKEEVPNDLRFHTEKTWNIGVGLMVVAQDLVGRRCIFIPVIITPSPRSPFPLDIAHPRLQAILTDFVFLTF